VRESSFYRAKAPEIGRSPLPRRPVWRWELAASDQCVEGVSADPEHREKLGCANEAVESFNHNWLLRSARSALKQAKADARER